MRRRSLSLIALSFVAGVSAAACEAGAPASPDGRRGAASDAPAPSGANGATGAARQLTADELRDPATCTACHRDHVTAWSGSMHAYASDDPLFRAMNARAQRETGGTLGDFCVRCHAPVAVNDKKTRDGLDLDRLDARYRGVTCFACHAVDDVHAPEGSALHLADDGVLRGSYADPLVAGRPHGAIASDLHDRTEDASAALCGTCHDVSSPSGAIVERTFGEWSTSPARAEGKTCGSCHMASWSAPIADVPGAPTRRVHDHAMAGVDLALTPFPEAAAQRAAVTLALGSALDARLCVRAGRIDASVTNARVGHAWPTGAAHDRVASIELVAYDAEGAVLLASTSTFHETLKGASGEVVPFLWQATDETFDALAPGETRALAWSTPAGSAKVTLRVHLRTLTPDIVDALVASGDLDPALRDAVPDLDLASTVLTWTANRGDACLP